MRQNTRRAGLLPQQDEMTVVFDVGNRPVQPAAARPALPADGVTVRMPGAVLAPAPIPEGGQARKAPVFLDESGARKRLLRIAGVLIALLSIGLPVHRDAISVVHALDASPQPGMVDKLDQMSPTRTAGIEATIVWRTLRAS